MKAYYDNGKLRFSHPRKPILKCALCALLVVLIVLLTAFSFGKSDFKYACGVEIPGIKNQKFCIGFDKGVYYENEKMKVRIK